MWVLSLILTNQHYFLCENLQVLFTLTKNIPFILYDDKTAVKKKLKFYDIFFLMLSKL